jgi:predicted nucleotide-binding protein (sugar kinase/HSP70/actin superfamily)
LSCISAGLSVSVVKNALYKVIRVARPSDLGEHIVVQGGTFMSDAVLRAFELETGRQVIRPSIAGLMGAYGAALYARENGLKRSTILGPEELKNFKHQVRTANCGGCTNNCRLTVNIFDGGRKYISGNRCERPLTGKAPGEHLNLYEYKRRLLAGYGPVPGRRGVIGIPMGLNMYEMLPFWHRFFTELGFEVRTSPESTRETYFFGQHTIPSDTVCYPAKLIHGHICKLVESGCDAIFYPCLSYNFDEGLGTNHYNGPVVAYYPEVIANNVHSLDDRKFIYDYIGIHRPRDFPKKMQAILAKYFPEIPLKEIKRAARLAYGEKDAYLAKVRAKGKEMLAAARRQGKPVIILAGRPYHLDPEINHGIDELICQMGAAVITEDSVSDMVEPFPTTVLNQWTYHARLYAAAKFVVENGDPDVNLVQLVSFGCGVDAITTDEVRSILEQGGRIYTQIKIDEITNLGAVRIRLRSLLAAVDYKKRHEKGGGEIEKAKALA